MSPWRTLRRRGAPLVALVLGMGLCAVKIGAQAARQPYSKQAIIDLLKGEVAPQRVAALARQRGIDFQITPEVESELRRAGATDSLLATLRELAPRAPKPPIETPRRAVPPPAAVTLRDNPKDGLKYVWIPPGTFMMGCSPGDSECQSSEKPAHQVTITKGLWLGQTPVTVGAYKRFAADTRRPMARGTQYYGSGFPMNFGWANEAAPIVDVNWDDAQAYCSWAGGRLPTEAEWEYAARAGSTATRYGDLDEIAWYADNSGRQRLDSTSIGKKLDQFHYAERLWDNGNAMHEVGQKRRNDFGLYDMLGNVWEWVSDWYDQNYYRSRPSQDATGPAGGQLRVLRGGAWDNNPRVIRVSVRSGADPAGGSNSVGFRCGGGVFAP